MRRRFLFVHGASAWGLSCPQHWQRWLAERLRDRGQWVSFPLLHDPSWPSVIEAEAALDLHLDKLAAEEGERVVLCQSMGCVLWLRHAPAVRDEQRPDRVLLVAPPSGSGDWPQLQGFFPAELDRDAVASAARSTRLVCSDDDLWCPEGAAFVYGQPLGIPTEVIPGAGHIDDESGFGPWPHLEEWCLGQRPGVAR